MKLEQSPCGLGVEEIFQIDLGALIAISMDALQDMVVWIAADASIVFANAAARRHFDRLGFDYAHRKLYEIVTRFDGPAWDAVWQELLRVSRPARFESLHGKGDLRIPVEVSASVINYDGRTFCCALFHDISERKRLEAELSAANENLERLTRTDPLSGLGNRREFDRSLRDVHDRGHVNREPVSLILLDIDYFKAYNDTYGHVAGDACLCQIGAVLRQCARRETDVIARIGGEEFACLLPSTSLAGALSVANMVRDMIHGLRIPHAASQAAPYVTASFGVVSSAAIDFETPTALIEAADRCLYASKAQGRDRITGEKLVPPTALAASA